MGGQLKVTVSENKDKSNNMAFFVGGNKKTLDTSSATRTHSHLPLLISRTSAFSSADIITDAQTWMEMPLFICAGEVVEMYGTEGNMAIQIILPNQTTLLRPLHILFVAAFN